MRLKVDDRARKDVLEAGADCWLPPLLHLASMGWRRRQLQQRGAAGGGEEWQVGASGGGCVVIGLSRSSRERVGGLGCGVPYTHNTFTPPVRPSTYHPPKQNRTWPPSGREPS